MEEFSISVSFADIGDSRTLSFPGLFNYRPSQDALLEFASQAVFRVSKGSIFLSDVKSQDYLLGHEKL